MAMLNQSAIDHGCALHAFVFMDNHTHLLATPQAFDGPSWMMKQLGERYVRYFNKRHGRVGTLWDGRFKSSLVETDRYLLNCYRYIEANPVRAGMVRHPSRYYWSSHRFNVEGRRLPLVIRPHPVYLALGATESKRRAAYERLFRKPLSDEDLHLIRDCINGSFALGDEPFIEALEERLERRVSAKQAGRPVAPRRMRAEEWSW